MDIRRHRARLLVVATGIAGTLASVGALGLPAAARAGGFAASVPRGGITLPAGSRDLGADAADAPLRATIALRPRDAAALAAYAAAVSDPSSPDYHHYLTVGAFARRFAPTAAQRALVSRSLRRHGLLVTAASPNGLSITVRGSARVTADAFSTAIDRFALPDGATAQAPTSTPRLAGAAGRLVEGIVGLDSVAPTSAIVIHDARRSAGAESADAVTRSPDAAGPQPCPAAQSAVGADGFTANEIASRYGLSDFYAAGDEGRGVTIALYELEPFSVSDISAYQACMGTSATVETETVDGGAGSGFGSGEAASDIEDIIGLAPQATIRVYEGPQSGEGAYATYSQIISDDAAQVVSTSWGLCESELGTAAADAENTLFEEAAAQGQSVLAASGDSGADDCGDGTLAVDDPASQPWVTGVGGTSVHGDTESVWDDSLGAGGGGASQLWGRPAWQTASVAQSAVGCGASGTSCREVPDLSADADPATGYAAYYHGGWRIVGGTSVAVPTVAALTILADASPACSGHPLGFLDPALYAHADDLADVTSGSNGFDGVAGWSAGSGYDMASGLGTPTALLGPALCGDTLSLAAPAKQSWTAGSAVSVADGASSSRGAAVTWRASGLPAGVAIDPTTGRITGTPTSAGRSTVTLTAIDADGASATASFDVTVGPASRASDDDATADHSVQRLYVIAARVGAKLRVRLAVRDTRGDSARFLAHGLPRGLRVARDGVLSGTPRTSGRMLVTIDVRTRTHGVIVARVEITVRRAAPARAHHRSRRRR